MFNCKTLIIHSHNLHQCAWLASFGFCKVEPSLLSYEMRDIIVWKIPLVSSITGDAMRTQNANEKVQASLQHIKLSQQDIARPFNFLFPPWGVLPLSICLSTSLSILVVVTSLCMLSPWEHAHSLCRLGNFHCFKGILQLDFNPSKRLLPWSITPEQTYFSSLLISHVIYYERPSD